ncbi:hypothetical protein LI177_11045 [bacterium 210820-DFI.6.37]|nr:hypothetical protein [bacterium 210820-DFI.6.37]
MIKKWIAVFLIFFMGMTGLISVDRACRESTGAGGTTGLSVAHTRDGGTEISFFGLHGEIGK